MLTLLLTLVAPLPSPPDPSEVDKALRTISRARAVRARRRHAAPHPLVAFGPHSRFTDKEFATLACLTDLTGLNMRFCAVTGKGMVALRGMWKLRSLDLSDTHADDMGMPYVGELFSLTSLALRQTRVSDRGLVHLKSLTRLRSADLADALGRRGGQALSGAKGWCPSTWSAAGLPTRASRCCRG